MHTLEKKFPAYFESFCLPEGSASVPIKVYRACKTRKLEAESFLPSIVENEFIFSDPENPGEYSLSSFENPNHVKRFATNSEKYDPLWKIAIGETAPCCGVSQRSRERGGRKKGDSHVDWWLYEGARPYEHFELIEDFENHLETWKKEREANE